MVTPSFGVALAVNTLQHVDGKRDTGARDEDAGEEAQQLETLIREGVAHQQDSSDEETQGHDEGDDVHPAILANHPAAYSPIRPDRAASPEIGVVGSDTLATMSPSIVIAPDSFKGSLSARGVAEAVAAGWRSVRPLDELVLLPQADGGEGTLDAVEASVAGAVRRDAGEVTGPDGRPTRGEWLELPGGVAVIELAQPSGIPLMQTLDPLGATTRGLGEVIAAALDAGSRSLVVGLGGSASTDGGAGALAALGLGLRDDAGEPIADGGAALARLHTVDVSGLRDAPTGGVLLLSDVTSPLLGPAGAAAVFAPQKGATPDEVELLDAALARFASLLGGDPEIPGTGAAGGTGYGLAAAWGASIRSGADHLAGLSGLVDAIEGADVLLLGEGRFDSQSLAGKVVGQLLLRAEAGGVRVGVVAGQVATGARVAGRDVWTRALVDLAGSVEAAIASPAAWLHAAGADAARHFGAELDD
jgi:glycerate kinase